MYCKGHCGIKWRFLADLALETQVSSWYFLRCWVSVQVYIFMLQSTVMNCAVVLDSQELFGNAMGSVLIGMKIVQRARLARSLDDLNSILTSEPQSLIAIVDPVALGSGGPAAVRSLRQKFSSLRIVVVSTSSTRNEILSYIASGAHGFILKTQTGKEIVSAIRVVLSGNIFVPPMVCDLDPVTDTQEPEDHSPVVDVPTVALAEDTPPDDAWLRARVGNPIVAPGIHLSSRQQTVLRLISKGLSNKAIARELGLAESTVKVHINNMFKVLKVNNRIEAVARAGWQN